MKKITTERCMCGHRSCRDTWLVGIGKFVQGSGFTPEEAEEIVQAVNRTRADEARAFSNRKTGVPLTGREAFSSGYSPRANPHPASSVAAMLWVSDWWRANAECFADHIGEPLVDPVETAFRAGFRKGLDWGVSDDEGVSYRTSDEQVENAGWEEHHRAQS